MGNACCSRSNGQFLLVIPVLDLVIVHLTNPDDPASRPLAGEPLAQLLCLILAARLPSKPAQASEP